MMQYFIVEESLSYILSLSTAAEAEGCLLTSY